MRPEPIAPGPFALHLAVLWSFAVAQPLFQTLQDDPSFFVGRGSTSLDIVVFAVTLVAAPAAIGAGVVLLLARLRPASVASAQAALIAAAAALLGLQLAKQIAPGAAAGAVFASAAAAAALLSAGYARTRFVPATLSVLGPAPVLFAALFLLTAPISKLVFPAEPAPPAERVEARAPVVMIVFDELPLATLLRPDRTIDESRFPAFAGLAEESRWHRGAITVSSFTHVAVPAMLAGDVGETRVPSASVHPRSLFSALGESHRMDVVEPVTELCPESACGERERDGVLSRLGGLAEDLLLVEKHKLLPESITRSLPPVDQGFAHFVDVERSVEVQEQMSDFARGLGSGPVLHYFHNPFLPHPPWQRLPDGTTYDPTLSVAEFEEGERGDLTGGPGAIVHLWQRHMLQAGYADRLLGRMIDRLKRAGAWDEALVVVVADHGASFRAGASRRTIGSRNLGGIAPVPLFVKKPGASRGSVSDELICISAIPSLVSAELGIEPPFERGDCEREPDFFAGVGAKRIRRALSGVVQSQATLFPPGAGWTAVYRALDDRRLTGRRVSSFEIEPEAEVDLTPAGGRAERANGEPLAFSPLLHGTASEPLPPRARIAVAIDGRIAGVGAPLRTITGDGFAAIVPPRLISSGEVSLYLVGGGRRPTLAPMRLSSEEWTAEEVP